MISSKTGTNVSILQLLMMNSLNTLFLRFAYLRKLENARNRSCENKGLEPSKPGSRSVNEEIKELERLKTNHFWKC